MKSTILSVGIKILFPLFIFFSLFMLFRGHNEPGGGFIGGLIGSTAFVFYTIAFGTRSARALLPFDPVVFIALGLLVALIAGLSGIIAGEQFFSALWPGFSIPFIGKPGTPIVFDIGVYILVLGIILKITFSLSDVK